jgi:hypothetical protein
MHKLSITIVVAAAAFLCGGLLARHAEAMISAGAAQIRAAAEKAVTVEPAACRGRGAHCPPGYVWNGRRCVPC